jgi:hypothetical protein
LARLARKSRARYSGSSATTLAGPPEPPSIFIGNASNKIPVVALLPE